MLKGFDLMDKWKEDIRFLLAHYDDNTHKLALDLSGIQGGKLITFSGAAKFIRRHLRGGTKPNRNTKIALSKLVKKHEKRMEKEDE